MSLVSGGNLTSTAVEEETVVPLNGLILLSTVTAASAATVDIEVTFDAKYDNYVMIGNNLLVSQSNVTLDCLFKLDGAYSTSNYEFHTSRTKANSASYSAVNGTSQNRIKVLPPFRTDSRRTANFTLRTFVPSDPTLHKQITSEGSCVDGSSGVVSSVFCAGMNTDTGALTGLRFKAAGGTLSGTFTLYGLIK